MDVADSDSDNSYLETDMGRPSSPCNQDGLSVSGAILTAPSCIFDTKNEKVICESELVARKWNFIVVVVGDKIYALPGTLDNPLVTVKSSVVVGPSILISLNQMSNCTLAFDTNSGEWNKKHFEVGVVRGCYIFLDMNTFLCWFGTRVVDATSFTIKILKKYISKEVVSKVGFLSN
ncbi:hypothetical protein BAE44_0001636 [Dichanthelium oligosanthes]|uniref:Uncharacterized protein n=1 Tax=Dichanthelium oligosanthes TaxID=888268 RepID=A0A1E5WIW6_9POAL|nr:hypothetical protein BAE44_0001636 [Dichanthelium oligosanthes]